MVGTQQRCTRSHHSYDDEYSAQFANIDLVTRCVAVRRHLTLAAGARARTTGFDGLERISTQTQLDILEVPQRQRTAGTYRHPATLMAQFGWSAVRVRDFTRGDYREQIRWYVRGGHAAEKVARADGQCVSVEGEKVATNQRSL